MEKANDNVKEGIVSIKMSEGELYNKISDGFYDLLSGLNPEERTKEIEQLLQEFEVVEPPEEEAEGKVIHRGLGKTYRAVQKSDLKLFEEMLKVGVVGGFSTAVSVLAALNPMIIYGLIILIYRYWRKGIKLTYEQGIVLKAVKEA